MVSTTFDNSQIPLASMGYQNISNILDNGGLEIFQRGISNNPVEGQYTVADRWKVVSLNGTATFTASKETGASNVDSGASSLKLNLTATGSATLFDLGNYVENFASYRGKTISIYARVKSNVATALRISDGTVVTTIATHTGNGNFQTLQGTFTVSSSATELMVVFRNSASAIFTTYIDSVMLVLGSTPVPFIPTNLEVDLARCQRYYEQSYPAETPAGTTNSTGAHRATAIQISGATYNTGALYFKVTKRINPTITLYAYDTGAAGSIGWQGGTFVSTVANISQDQFTVQNTNTQNYGYIHFTASADL